MRWFFVLSLIGILTSTGCSPRANQRISKPIQSMIQTSPWIFTSTNPNDSRGNHGVYISNGVIGLSAGPFGPDKNSAVFLAGVYDKSENILPIPLIQSDTIADPTTTNYKQTLDIQHGTLTTEFTDENGHAGRIVMFASRSDRSLIVFRYEGAAKFLAKRIKSLPRIQDTFQGIEASIVISETNDGQSTTLIGRVTSPITLPTSFSASEIPYKTMLANHQKQWEAAWKSDIVIDGDHEAQRIIHKALFDLRQSAAPRGSNVSIAPEGLAGNFYKGHIFWDADVWILPALLPFDPYAALDIVAYRKSVTKSATPWESGITGKELAPSGFSDGRHVIADAGYGALCMLETSANTNDRKIALTTLIKAANELAARGFKSGPPSTFGTVTGPDELNMGVMENAYTNVMAKQVLIGATKFAAESNVPVDTRWKALATELVVPLTSDGLIAKCKDDDGRKTKQADGELALWPGNATSDLKLLAKSFDYHKSRPIKNGPAMTDAIHALIAARLGRRDEAEQNFRAAYQPFIRGPFMLFSEKRSLDRCVFVTGLGGLVQAVVYGYAGLEFSGDQPTATKTPVLPTTWKSLTLKGVFYRGHRFDVQVTPKASSIKRLD